MEPSSCSNALRDGDELGVDCGGACAVRCTESACSSNEACATGACVKGVCAQPTSKGCGEAGANAACTDGQACELGKDCKSGFCDAFVCATPAPASHTDGAANAGETDIDCGGSAKPVRLCRDGQKCFESADCVGTCTSALCGPIGPTDGKKNNAETAVDCGGPNAPKCASGKDCAGNSDCDEGYCSEATRTCTSPRYDDGVKNGSETDVDCGGSGMGSKKCAEAKDCLADSDCQAACTYASKCVDIPSCKPRFGGDTCGVAEPGDAQAAHESCCKTLPVSGYVDTRQPGKTVYLDKYEITAGRMRAFVDAVSEMNGGAPKIRDYMASHRPTAPYRWNPGWEATLPNALVGGSDSTFTVTNPTTNVLYPGQDEYLNPANRKTQSTWSVGAGTFTIDVDLVRTFTSAHFFPEYITGPGGPGGPIPDYAASHDLNCSNTAQSYGFSTYWFDAATLAAHTGDASLGKAFTKDELDQKALNCTPFGQFAAFCAWDGGQLMTTEVFDYVAGGAWPDQTATSPEPPRLVGGKSRNCNGNTLNTFSDGTQSCASVYYFPNDRGEAAHDGSSRIAPPGRVPADQVRINPADEPWMDLKGNLEEAVLRPDTARFDYRGYGVSWGSIIHHRLQQTTPRMKGGSFGARCMRFR